MANNPYFSIEDRTMAEVEVNKSRFIAVAVHVENVDDVKEVLGTLKKSNPNAAHIPYAYILGESGKSFDPKCVAAFKKIYPSVRKLYAHISVNQPENQTANVTERKPS